MSDFGVGDYGVGLYSQIGLYELAGRSGLVFTGAAVAGERDATEHELGGTSAVRFSATLALGGVLQAGARSLVAFAPAARAGWVEELWGGGIRWGGDVLWAGAPAAIEEIWGGGISWGDGTLWAGTQPGIEEVWGGGIRWGDGTLWGGTRAGDVIELGATSRIRLAATGALRENWWTGCHQCAPGTWQGIWLPNARPPFSSVFVNGWG